MKVLLCLAAILLGAIASPQGYYSQQYNYTSSASSYKNNELQHQTDDSGSYSKSGDLEGRTKPKVKSNSEHSEYVNPRLREGYYNGNADLTSGGYGSSGYTGGASGASRYQVGSQYGSSSQDLGQVVDRTGEYNNYNSYSGSQTASSQYSTSSAALNSVAGRVQNDLQQEILSALQDQAQYNRLDVAELEAELRRNLTARLQQILQQQYGTQTISNGQSYTLVGGRPQAQPNYEQQDLVRLQNSLQNNLVQQLRKEYNSRYSSGQHLTSHNQNTNQNFDRPTYTYRPIYPNLNTAPTERPYSSYPSQPYQTLNNYQHNGEYNNRVVSNVRYTPVANPLSITTIASNTQSRLDAQLNELLEYAQRRYFARNSGYTAYFLDSVLDRLKQELRNNLTVALNEGLREQYGNQIQKDGYTYSVGSSGQVSGQHNYNSVDLDNLKKQVQENLLTKLTRDFESAKQRYISSTQQSQYTSTNGGYTNDNIDAGYYGTNTHQNTGTKSNGYQLISGSHQAGYEYSGSGGYGHSGASNSAGTYDNLASSGTSGSYGNTALSNAAGYYGSSASSNAAGSYGSSGGTVNIANLQNQLQNQLSQQLQQAISKQYTTRLASSGYGNSASFDTEYQRLYAELQRNLTRQLEDFLSEGGYSSSYGSNDVQLANLKSQLQNSLASQLQQGLRQSYSASASYSASSSSSGNAGGTYGSSSGGAYKGSQHAGYQEDECCGGYGYRQKRSTIALN